MAFWKSKKSKEVVQETVVKETLEIKEEVDKEHHKLSIAFTELFNRSKLLEPSLPQNVDKATKQVRETKLHSERAHYQYTYDTNVPGAPYLWVSKEIPLPSNERPHYDWIVKVAETIIPILARGPAAEELVQTAIKTLFDAENDPHKLEDLLEMITAKTFKERPQNIGSYDWPFGDKKYLPESASDYTLDASFCRYRLAGPNPMMIRPCEQAVWQRLEKDVADEETRARIDAVFKAGRLYCVDYSALAKVKGGINAGTPKYPAGATALFELPEDEEVRTRESLLVMAIQCNPDGPVYLPSPKGDEVQWKIAKAVFNSCDGDYHEAVMHLAHTHLVMESFLVATHRELPPQHPISVLLLPHFEGTAFINHLANTKLISPGGGVAVLVSGDIGEIDQLVGDTVLEILSDDFSFPALLKRRKMDADNFPAPFPYRDDGMLVWEAVKEWVTSYLAIYYGSGATAEENIAGDYELNRWIDTLGNSRQETGGRVGWIGDEWKGCSDKMAMLTTIVSAVMFTGSAQHAAVNFPQNELMAFTPGFPLALYQPVASNRDKKTEQDYLDILPAMEAANTQRIVGGFLGGVHYTTLGQYRDSQFVDKRVAAPLKVFQTKLRGAATKIDVRNAQRVAAWAGKLPLDVAKHWAYEYLLPQNIPQSINI
mmetsp:Transcript_6743/g.10664  ORF Transcript_6743/g.10664 Transcript_6743/m.10664 type:complete len:655 (-) Transcript_6743:39-2003(-)